ncbi:MAG: hypothetical protein JWL73_2332, partial [Actinomycetia bacterium]|nr:hypothetical protein [Actinomycetes bacterium]
WIEPPDAAGEPASLRCAYHGWRYGSDGRCFDVPAMPDGPIPPRACAQSFDAQVAYDLVWVRIDPAGGTRIPPNPGFGEATMHTVPGTPYTWGVGAARRVENFTDLPHFAWVHDGTLGNRDDPVPQLPAIRREDGELRFEFDPPDMETDPTALFGMSRYRVPLPLTVDIEFELDTGARRRLWMTASPVRDGVSRTFWCVSRDDDPDGDDDEHLDFQRIVLEQDEPVVTNQVPPELSLAPGFEVSLRPDRVSIEYRRWLRELAVAAAGDPASIGPALGATEPVPVGSA